MVGLATGSLLKTQPIDGKEAEIRWGSLDDSIGVRRYAARYLMSIIST